MFLGWRGLFCSPGSPFQRERKQLCMRLRAACRRAGWRRGTHGLTSVDGGVIIYDANQKLCWLGNANLAGDSEARAHVKLAPTNRDGSTPVINPDGTMNYQTALNWVSALNSYNGEGWLNHHNWQLPTKTTSV
jgi:hypothetical protein